MRYIAEILCYCFALNLYAQDFWEETSGPIGGWVQCLAVDNQNNVYAGFDAGWFGENHKGRCFYRSNNLGGYWVSINTINYNKDIESIAIDSSGYIYLWEGGVGLLKSTDEGINWIRKSFGLNDFFNAKIKVCKNNSLILGHYDGVYVSTNCGITWNLTSLTNWSNSIFVDSSDNIFVSIHNGGIYKSTDLGVTWIQSDNGVIDEVVEIIQLHDSVYYAATQVGLFLSNDFGVNWKILPDSPLNITCISLNKSKQIFVGTENKGIFISTDEGNTWRSFNNGLYNLSITCIVSLPSDDIIVGTYGDGLYKHTEDSRGWHQINSGIKSVHIVAINKMKEILYTGSQQGIISRSSDNGQTWESLDSNYVDTPILSFGQSLKGSLFFSTWKYRNFLFKNRINADCWNSQDIINFEESRISDSYGSNKIFKSEDDGKHWIEVADVYVNSFSNYFDPSSGTEYLFAATGSSGVYKSTDDGLSWLPANNGISGQYIEDIESSPVGYIFASSSNKIFRSDDFGKSWVIIYSGSSSVYHIALEVTSNNFLFAGLDWGAIILSTDNGSSWMDRKGNLPVNRINSITSDSLNRIYVGNWWGQIYQSLDFGLTWLDIQYGMIGGPVLNIHCDNNGQIFVGPYGGGIYRGVNSTFVPPQVKLIYPGLIGNNFPLTPTLKWYSSQTANDYFIQVAKNSSFDSLSILYEYLTNDTTIITDSLLSNTRYYWRVKCSNHYGWSIWSVSRSFKTLNITDIQDSDIPPKTFSLSQNYPNPFNPSTKISWQSPVSCWQTLKVYDVLGNEVATLVDEYKPAGSYNVEFNASKLSSGVSARGGYASGVYFYQLKAGDFVETKKMILMK